MEGEQRRDGGGREKEEWRGEPEVSLLVPRFDAFSNLMAFADGCIEK